MLYLISTVPSNTFHDDINKKGCINYSYVNLVTERDNIKTFIV